MNKASSPLDILLCPFCGLKPSETLVMGDLIIECKNERCGVRGMLFHESDWNRRKSPQAPALTPAEAGRLVDEFRKATAAVDNPCGMETEKEEAQDLERLVLAHRALLTALTQQPQEGLRWTREKPTDEGWYWYRSGGDKGTACVYQQDGVMEIIFDSHSVMEEDDDLVYAGPIPEPQEAPKEGRKA